MATMKTLQLWITCLVSLFLVLGCGNAKLKEEIELKAPNVKYIDYDNPERCSIHKRCKYLLSESCWTKRDEFSRCKEKFRRTAAKFDGDTYLFTMKPRYDKSEDLLWVQGDIYHCSDAPLKLNRRVEKKIRGKTNFRSQTVRYIPQTYQNECNILDSCEKYVELSCRNDNDTSYRRWVKCFSSMRRDLTHLQVDAMLVSDTESVVEKSSGHEDELIMESTVIKTAFEFWPYR